MKRIIHIVVLLSLGMTGMKCSDNFFDITNENETSSNNFYQNIADFETALTSCYSAVKGIDLYGEKYYIHTLLALPHESDYWNAQNRNEVTVADGHVANLWLAWYRVVARTNDLLGNESNLTTGDLLEEERDQLKHISAQAHFLRGFAYFHMVRLWGEASFKDDSSRLAVPLILKVATSRPETMQPRASVGRVYKQIIKDLLAAEAGLPDAWDDANIARVNKHVAKAFLGQVYLFMEDYEKARLYFEEVIQAKRYDLVPPDQYENLFQGKNEFSVESIWELNYVIDMSQNIWENGLGSGFALHASPLGRGYGNVTPHGVNIERFGSDPRLDVATIAEKELFATCSGTMEPVEKSTFNYSGHHFQKYVPKDYCVQNTNRTSGANFIIMRLADVYLMYAEVMNHLNQDNTAREYLNKVRRRAYGHNHELPSIHDIPSNVSGITLRDAIREERFLELFAEGHRWFDIVRWKIVEKEILKYNDKRKQHGEIIFDQKDYYYPIPLQELDNNENIKPSTDY